MSLIDRFKSLNTGQKILLKVQVYNEIVKYDSYGNPKTCIDGMKIEEIPCVFERFDSIESDVVRVMVILKGKRKRLNAFFIGGGDRYCPQVVDFS